MNRKDSQSKEVHGARRELLKQSGIFLAEASALESSGALPTSSCISRGAGLTVKRRFFPSARELGFFCQDNHVRSVRHNKAVILTGTCPSFSESEISITTLFATEAAFDEFVVADTATEAAFDDLVVAGSAHLEELDLLPRLPRVAYTLLAAYSRIDANRASASVGCSKWAGNESRSCKADE